MLYNALHYLPCHLHAIKTVLVALEAGCQQQPPIGTTVSLNGSVFTEAPIQPSNPSATSSPSNGNLAGGAATIAGIVIGVLVGLLFLAGCVFVQYRKRRNRARARVRERLGGGRAQPFSFYQQQRARESEFSDISRGDYYQDVVMANTPPAVGGERRCDSFCSSVGGSPIDVDVDDDKPSASRPAKLSMAVPWPPPIHPSPREGGFHDILTTPPSTSTSTRSNLLISPIISPGFGIASPRIISPRWTRDTRPNEGGEAQQVETSTKDLKKKNSWGAVAPIESQNIQVKFDPPPKKAKK